MRISDWSSDVCSSDLAEIEIAAAVEAARRDAAEVADTWQCDGDQALQELVHLLAAQRHLDANRIVLTDLERRDRDAGLGDDRLLTSDRRHFLDSLLENLAVGRGFTDTHVEGDLGDEIGRATSELQSLMRISYAVFCLKKKKEILKRR